MELLLFFSGYFAVAYAGCYWPNGTDRNAVIGREAYRPCSSTAAHSMCCRTSDTGPDTCRDDGLCDNAARDAIWRESCTDITWQSDSCLKLCVSGTYSSSGGLIDAAGNDVIVTPCDDGSFCCGDSVTGPPCCDAGEGFWLLNGEVFSTKPTSTVSSTATSSASTVASALTTDPSSTASSTSSPSAAPSKSRDYTGVIAGSVVGGIAALALLITVLWWLSWKKKKTASSGQQANVGQYGAGAYQTGYEPYKYEQQNVQASTVYHPTTANSAPSPHARQELG